jgi:Hint domain-containing protein
MTLLALVTALTACGASPGTGASGSPTPTVSPGAGGLSPADLKYRLIDRFGVLWFCDPDEYPVAHGDEQQLAEERLPEIRQDVDTYAAITKRLGVDQPADPDPANTLAIYRAWKMLNALVLEPAEGGYAFDAIFAPAADAQEGTHVAGQIALDGSIEVRQQVASGPPPCPICLAEGTRIATPDGDVAVERLAVGSRVLTRDGAGNIVIATVRRIGSAPVPASHVVVRLTLADGRSLSASPGHPLADGRTIGSLRLGDRVDGSTVRSFSREAYTRARTYDLLPSGETGTYWANGILLGSTLSP